MSKIIKFAHLADLHLGGWREKKLTKLNFITFEKSIDKIIELDVDFVLFAGDIFNTAIPPIEIVEKVIHQLMKLKKANIPLYVIGGSHDYSNSGKSFISLLEATELFKDVSKCEYLGTTSVNLKFFKDKSGANISGILGRKNGLDKNIYENLTKQNLSKDNFNIFMFHCTLDDIKPDFMKNVNCEIKSNMLPKGFDYYAGGHIHEHIESKYDKKPLSYPGVLFPNNFRELITQKPSFNLCTFDFETRETKIERIFLKTYEKEHIKIDVDNLNPIEAESKIREEIEKVEIEGKIILLEIFGIICGKITDIKINKIIQNLYDTGAYVILKNTYKLKTLENKNSQVYVEENILDLEKEIIKKNLESYEDIKNYKKEFELAKTFLSIDLSKINEEKNLEYENRIREIFDKILI